MNQKISFIAECEKDENFSAICRRFGIARKTGYKWVDRFNQLGVDGLKDRPPITTVPHRTSSELVDTVITARKEHPTWGPRKLRALLSTEQPEKSWPAASTIGEMLKRHGLIRPRRRRIRTPPGTGPFPPCEAPNDVWAIDFKGHFALGDGTRCHPLTVTDGASRYLIKCEALANPIGELVRKHLELAFREFGLPLRIRSDNGSPFAGLTAGGLSKLSVWWIKLGIVPERIQPAHPEQNGRHERMHRTLKAEATDRPKQTMAEQQRAFDVFRHEYNDLRPHEALGQIPPAKRYEPSIRPYPATLTYPEYVDCEVRWTRRGAISFRNQRLQLASTLTNEPVGLKQVSETVWEVWYGPVLLGVLDEQDKPMKLREMIWREADSVTSKTVTDVSASDSGDKEPDGGDDEPVSVRPRADTVIETNGDRLPNNQIPLPQDLEMAQKEKESVT